MNKLLNISKYIWFSLIVTILLSIYILYLILNMNIESSYSTQAVASDNYSSIFVDTKGAYLLNNKSHLTLKINNQYISCTIKRIRYLQKQQKFEVVLNGLDTLELIPNTKIPIEIIYDNTKVIQALLNPSV